MFFNNLFRSREASPFHELDQKFKIVSLNHAIHKNLRILHNRCNHPPRSSSLLAASKKKAEVKPIKKDSISLLACDVPNRPVIGICSCVHLFSPLHTFMSWLMKEFWFLYCMCRIKRAFHQRLVPNYSLFNMSWNYCSRYLVQAA